MSEALTRTGDPQTSFDAAASVDVSTQMNHLCRSMWLASRRNRRPVTDTEIRAAAWALNFKDTSQGLRSRRSTLQRSGLVEAIDREGISPNGRKATRWLFTDAGIRFYMRQIEVAA